MKKIKWPKFLNLKRTILLSILVLVVGYLLIYFLGGYSQATQDTDIKDFTTEGFVSYETTVTNIINTTVKQENDQFVEDCKVLNKSNYKTELNNLLNTMKTVENGEHLKTILVSNRDEWNVSDSYLESVKTAIENKCISNEDRAEQLLNEFTLLFKNDNYAFYFNKRYTTFRIDYIQNGYLDNVIYSWYSNPQNSWSDPSSGLSDPYGRGDSSAIVFNQQSPLILNFLTKSGDVKKLSVYEHSISDRSGSGNTAEVIMPTFEIKIDEQNKSIQVLYHITKKGISYADFPKYISLKKYDNSVNAVLAEGEETLVERNQKMVDGLLAELKGYYDSNNLEQIQKYVNAHKSETMIYNYAMSISDFVGRYAYDNYARLTGKGTPVEVDNKGNVIDEKEYLEKIDTIINNIDELYELACEMVRVEYLWNYKTSDYYYNQVTKKETGFYSKDGTVFRQYYGELRTPTDSAGNEILEDRYIELTPYNRTLKKPVQKDLYQMLYKKLGYTQQDLEDDNTYYNVTVEDVYIECDIAVEYQLTENGLKATVLTDSIRETQAQVYPLYKVDLLPYFTAENCEIKEGRTTYQTNGGMIIPDGSGAYISLNNGKTLYSQYSKPVYSTDLAFGSKVEKTASQDVLLPMYGFISNSISNGTDTIKNSTSIIARVSKGAAQATLNSSISKVTDSYNNIYYSTTYRESQLVTIGTGYYQKEITRFTDVLVSTDTVVDYYLYASETVDYTYSDVAKAYQQILVKEGILSDTEKDTTNETILNAELLGVYDYTTNFLGIVYSGHDTLTTYNEALTILDSLKSWGAKSINVLYRGWRDGGLVNESFKDMSFADKLGTKKEYENFVSTLEEENINLYPITSFLEIHKYSDAFGKNRYSTRDISNEYTKKYPYHLAGNVYDTKQRAYYTLSPRFFEVFAEILAEDYHKSNPDLNGMAFEKLGSKLVGDYKKRNVFYKQDSLNETIKAFETLAEVGQITNISLNAPYEFAIQYADNITNLSYDSTLYEVFDYSIPFYQLVLSGYKDYSGLVINANDEIALNRHMMNILMSGSNVHFTFSYDNSNKLIQTDYNYYYYTQYSQWEKEVSEVLSILDTYNIHEYQLQSHNVVKDATGRSIDKVYVVTYANKTNPQDTFQVFLNYSDKPAQILDRNNSVQNLNSWSYIIDKEVK